MGEVRSMVLTLSLPGSLWVFALTLCYAYCRLLVVPMQKNNQLSYRARSVVSL